MRFLLVNYNEITIGKQEKLGKIWFVGIGKPKPYWKINYPHTTPSKVPIKQKKYMPG
jgi:hypothetical protein